MPPSNDGPENDSRGGGGHQTPDLAEEFTSELGSKPADERLPRERSRSKDALRLL